MFHCKVLCLILLLTATTFGQTTSKTSTDQQPHYPRVIHAEVPLYPPIARLVHISGTVEIQVVVEKGVVLDAQVKSVVVALWNGPQLTDEDKKKLAPYLSTPSLANVKTWHFDSQDRTAFLVTYR